MADGTGSKSNLPPEFKLERFFSKYEFNPKVKHLMCCSDVEPLSMRELINMADPESRDMWEELSLGYTESAGHPDLRQEVAKLHGVLPAETLICCPQEGIYLAMNCMVDLLKQSGQTDVHAVATFPSYQSLFQNLQTAGVKVDYWRSEFTEGQGWTFSMSALRAALCENTRILVVNFPHNPTGFVPSASMWAEILQLCRERSLYLFSDEMYRFAINADDVTVLPSACAEYDRAVTLFGMSKTLALPGLRLGWVCTRDSALMSAMSSFKDYTTICCPAPSEVLSLIGLRARDRIIARTLGITRRNLREMERFAADFPGLVEWYSPAGGTTGLLRLTSRLLGNGGAEDWCRRLVEEAGILLAPGAVFDYVDDCARIGFGRKNIPEALDALRDYIRSLQL